MCVNDKYLQQQQAVNALWEFLNKTFFESALSKPVITIQHDHKNKSYGWFTAFEAWQSGEEKSPELNISANNLDRAPIEVVGTLLHEMCHQYAYANKLQDTSRGGSYHNKVFKDIAEKHGLVLEKTAKGWTGRALTESARQTVEPQINSLLNMKRFTAVKSAGKTSSTRKYVCPECGLSVRATKEVRVICAECQQMLVEE